MTVPFDDPWAVAEPTRRVPAWVVTAAWAVAAAVIGVAGPYVVVHGNGGAGIVGGRWLLAAAALAAAALVASARHRWSAVALAVALVVPVAEAQSRIGRAPWLLTLAGVVLADAALSDRWRDVRRGGEPTSAAPVALPALGLLVAAQALWIHRVSEAAMVALLAAVVVLLALRRRLAVVGVGRRVTAVGLRVGSVLGAMVLLVVALPTLYLGGALSWVLRHLSRRAPRWDAPGSTWRPQAVSEADRQRDARQPFASTPRPVRLGRTLAGLAVLAAIAATTVVLSRRDQPAPVAVSKRDAVVAAGNTTPRSGSSQPTDAINAVYTVPYSERPAFAGADYADALQAEILKLDFQPSPVGDYRMADASGRYVNVRDGVRRTLAPTCACPRVDLWLAGGSGAFGYAQRDDHTIASDLVRLAAADHIALHVENLGVLGWTLWQEFQGVEGRLAAARATPDVLVFYDGYNDAMATLLDLARSGKVPDTPAVMADSDWADVLGRGPSIVESAGGADAVGAAVASRYDGLRRVIVSMADRMGIPTRFFFQPDALSSEVQVAPVRKLYQGTGLIEQFAGLNDVLEAATTALQPGVTNLRHVLDDASTPLFVDSVHPNEAGGAIIAAAIYRDLRAELLAKAH